MVVVVISNPTPISNEAEIINMLFAEGLEVLHLRKPDYPCAEIESLLKSISPRFMKRIVLHSCYMLIGKYNVKGIHLTGQYLRSGEESELKEIHKTAKKRGLSVSASFHSLEELSTNKIPLDYAFLSPIFNSISKEGYLSKIDKEELKQFLLKEKAKKTPKVIALGGINEENISEVSNLGFDGAALLGSIWQGAGESRVDTIKEIFNNIQSKIKPR